MSANIVSIENHKIGEFRVDVNLEGRRERFASMMDAQKWLKLMKDSADVDRILVSLTEIVITAKKQLSYKSNFAY